ncbi:pheA operon leader peptide PheL [uncultured Cedecea sp.]|nr:pheA operon leader peptide PheL [uncultured Cedecea sp.]
MKPELFFFAFFFTFP